MAKGLVITQTGEITLLKPASMEAFLEKKEKENRENIDFLKTTLADVGKSSLDQGIWNLACREVALSFDSEQGIVGSTYPPESATAALTANPGIIYIIEQYIKHEIFISELFEKYHQPSLQKMKGLYQKIMNKLP